MKKVLSYLIIFIIVAATVTAQNQDDNVVKITTSLVQIDASVTSKNGDVVKDLKPEDFEIYQDGKLQKITSVSFVDVENSSVTKTQTKKLGKNEIPAPSVVSRSNAGGRILTFVVDDGNCLVSIGGMNAAREGLLKFVNEQMLPNDSVAIYQTRAGSSYFQQYTSDKARLTEIIKKKIRWFPPAAYCANDNNGGFLAPTRNDSTGLNRGQGNFESSRSRAIRETTESVANSNQIKSTVSLLRYVVSGLEKAGGRKTVFFMSDGLPTLNLSEGSTPSLSDGFDALRSIIDETNRASVVFNTIDVRGVFDSSLSAEDDVESTQFDSVSQKRNSSIANSQDGLNYLAAATGGKFYRGNNFLDVPIKKALQKDGSYYLIAYQPEGDTFKSKNFNRISVKVKRPDLRVSSRAGFYGSADENKKAKPRNADSELYDAIIAPLPKAGLNLRLTALYENTQQQGSFVRALIFIEGSDINFVDDSNNMKKAVFDVVTVTLNEKNELVDDFNKTYTIKIPSQAVDAVRANGLTYQTDMPLKKNGSYTFRVAIRDASSRKIGSASQIINVPDPKKNKFSISNLILAQATEKQPKPTLDTINPENAFSTVVSTAIPAIRQFQKNTILAYGYTIYNANLDKATNQPKITTKIRLFKDGQMILDGKEAPAQLESQKDLTRINDYGYLRLNSGIGAGDYSLQIIVKDVSTNEVSAQDIDFEVLN